MDRPRLLQNVMVVAENFSLSKAQLDLLNRGLTFIPMVGDNRKQRTQLLLDIQNYHRKIKLATYFGNKGKREKPRFTPPSNWTPPPHKLPPEIHFLIKQDNKEIHKHENIHKDKGNLTEDENQALTELKQNKHIVIKPADKGSAVVILSREQYIFEAMRQLEDTHYYRKLDSPIYLHTVPMVQHVVDRLYSKKLINARQKQYLRGEVEPRIRRFYILPKIHKDPDKWTIPFKIPAGRPIVSDCGSETYATAEYIDHFLNPLSTKHPSYIKDTYHFISIVKGLKIPPNSFFFSIDIDSLYTNIETEAGLRAVKKIFGKYPDHQRPDTELVALLEINLGRNDFEFNDQYFLQVKGVAMGKKFAPAYANIFMADWEEAAINKCEKKPFTYLRYLDDIFGIWNHSEDEFKTFINTLDTHDPSIRLKYEFDHQSIDFLDTTVYKGQPFHDQQTLDIKVYFKTTDTHSLLFKSSYHPRHTYKGLVKSQLIRFHRICTQRADFFEAVRTLFRALRKRGYSRSFLRHCLKTFHIQRPSINKEWIPLITTFSPRSRLLNCKFKNNYRMIMENQGLLSGYQVISAFRRNSNLKDHLVRASLAPLQPLQKTTVLAGTFIRLDFVQNRLNKTIFKIPQTFTPRTVNCVYMIFCSRCDTQYIGETGNSISTRMMQHRYNIKHKKETHTLLVKHFISHGYHSLRVAGLQSNSSWTEGERKKMERKWIRLLDTREPGGLNMKCN